MTLSEKVKQYYDEFSQKKLLQDFRYPNLRQEKVLSLCDRFIPANSSVLEIGCGVGIVAKFVQTRAKIVLATDTSPINIEIAKRYASAPNTHFDVVDILQDAIPDIGYTHFDIVLLTDVIEHIPFEQHALLLEKLAGLLTENGRIILTFPTPAYQNYLRANDPKALQIVDENVEILKLIERSALQIFYLNHLDVWGKNQYVHLVLCKNINYEATGLVWSTRQKLQFRVRSIIWRLRHRQFLNQIQDYLVKGVK